MTDSRLLSIFGARRAARQSELHTEHRTPQHARPKRAPKAFLVEQRIERARDAVSAKCATPAERDLLALHIAVGTLA